jgi:serine protease Do
MSEQPKKSLKTGKRLFTFIMILFVLALGIAVGTLISYRVDATGPADSQLQIQTDGKPVVAGAYLALSQAFEEIANRIEPAVVNINTEELVIRRQGQDLGDSMNELFRRFGFGPNMPQFPEQETRRSLGSGVIVDPKGYIITNSHVVEGATKIRVSVPGGEEYTAKLIGTDPVSDIAIVKISGKTGFPCAKIGDSKAMRVGDWVIAIGSPFGLDQTVTAGIISATGRTFAGLTIEDQGPSKYSIYNDYLQTDAAINRGNSGGPLVNMKAEIVGINSFISTPSGASAGVGFAVPSHLFVKVYNQILQTGKVARGFFGVNMNLLPFTPAMANFFGVKQGAGVLITGLVDENGDPSESGPAAKAGLKAEDVIVEFDGKRIRSPQDFRLAAADAKPGRKAKVKVVRYGEEKVFEVEMAERVFEKEKEKDRFSFEEEAEKPKPEIGLELNNVPQNLAKALEISGGAYVTSVKPGSYGDEAGLLSPEQGGGDVIVAANGKTINSAQELFTLVKGLKGGEPVVLKFLRISPRQENGRISAVVYYTSIIKP